ncbi:NAD(P)H-hydrate dehydratase [Vulcaniibacterium tengchongense]|uniref:Bifunctional NAD(P)H-hydrate repair enzyme n=1 Tax=Vulcaniibacterium tengchongense TaxID=1273429 RepID=A0A3N4VQ83_9GAMM|nr:NAD(P)H-hydrate dehydratase [Vulcaniibacterium tengchongense]RPE81361.1 NAD(P)H-hydrate epimerase [Vulcaniibacterium tengchongense]
MSAPTEPFASALYDAAALRRIEAWAEAAYGDAFELMRRAGRAAWQELLRHWPQAQRIVVACGPGNNGGDGCVLARHAQESGRQVAVVHAPGLAPRGELARRAAREFVAAGGDIREFAGALEAADVVVDAVFGIGLDRTPDAAAQALLAAINAQGAPVLALDAPSGVDAQRGCAYPGAVAATRTLEFIAPKAGLRTGAALDHAGVCALAPLTLPGEAFAGVAPCAERLSALDLPRWLGPRRRDSHKGAHGRVLCIGGDHGSGGAIALCAEAALRCGAGLVEVATRERHVAALLARLPEAMVDAVEDADALADRLARAGMVALGPGLGRARWGEALFARALASGRPLLLDADALNLLAARPLALPADTVLTPHPGEAARLLGSDTAQVQRDRFGAARALCERYACVVVLKGAGTVVAAPHEMARVIAAGNPGMATGGMGDVLSGAIAALRAQGLAAFDAAACGALLHAVAGDGAAHAGGERGLLPSDLMPWLRRFANPEMPR